MSSWTCEHTLSAIVARLGDDIPSLVGFLWVLFCINGFYFCLLDSWCFVAWFLGFLVSWFQTFKVSKNRWSHITKCALRVFQNIYLISKMFKNLLDGSLVFVGPHLHHFSAQSSSKIVRFPKFMCLTKIRRSWKLWVFVFSKMNPKSY